MPKAPPADPEAPDRATTTAHAAARATTRAVETNHQVIAVEPVAIAQLELDPGNVRTHDETNIVAIAASLDRFGQRKPIVVWRDRVVAGNGTVTAAERLGWTHLAVSRCPDGWTEAEATAYAIADNRTAELAGWDEPGLAAQLGEIQAADEALFGAIGFGAEDLEALLARVEALAPRPALTDPDAAPDLPTIPTTVRGDLWVLGPHRLLCEDSRDPAVLELLMDGALAAMVWTDPPYGVEYEGKTADALTIVNDGAAGLPDLLARSFVAADAVLAEGGGVYVAHPGGALQAQFVLAFIGQWRLHQQLIWVKDTMVLGHADHHYRHEPILYGYKPGPGRWGRGGQGWYGDNSQTSVFEVPRPKRSETHPTMKPVDLIAPMIRNRSRPGALVLDPFGGSGSTLIAAHAEARVARLVELDPRYCDVICRRYQDHTGDIPILERTGEAHDFAEAA